MIGTTISHYKVTRLLGKGGMGEVYEALEEKLGRRVAIKVLLPRFAEDPEVTARFFNEARAVNLIAHPGLVQVHEFGEMPSGGAYMVMEYLPGVSLRERLKESSRLPEVEALQIAFQLASALAAAHAKDIVHRDLKPGNVMLVPDPAMPTGERAKLLDFGIAKLGAQAATEDQPRTRTGLSIGTPMYMAPEQCRGEKTINGKADVYSLGVMLYQLLSGRPPFDAESDGALLGQQMYEEPPPLLNAAPHVSRPVAALVHRMLHKRPDERPSAKNVEEILAEMAAAELPSGVRPSVKLETVRPRAKQTGEQPLSTLGSGVGQLSAPASLRLRHFLLSLTDRSDWLTAHTSPRQRLLGLGFVSLLVVLGIAVGVGRSLRPPMPPAPAVKPVAKVLWNLDSTPQGAQVFRKADQMLLGRTPWSHEQQAEIGQLAVVLRLEGYKDRELSLEKSTDVKLHETLEALTQPAEVSAGAGSRKRGKRGTKPDDSREKDSGKRGSHGERSRLKLID